jgi:CheY-like chemotaxis protein
MNVLFIDDDPEDIESYGEAIEYLNDSEYLADKRDKLTYKAYTNCSNITDILSNLKEAPDVIFLDINMPIVGGKECLRVLKAHPKYHKIPVIMFSTTCPSDQAYVLKALGAADCIQKPNNFRQLVKIFSKYIFQSNQ